MFALIGTFYRPKSILRPVPSVIVLAGSSGGMWERASALLASCGFPAFALGYFGVEGLPKKLINIPLEYFRNGIEWLQSQEEVDPDSIAVMGRSRGAELSLLLGAIFPQLIKGVIAYLPSNFIQMGFEEGCYHSAQKFPSWTFGGKPLPWVEFATDQVNWNSPTVRLTPGFFMGENEEAEIQVQRILGQVLLISGTEDAM